MMRSVGGAARAAAFVDRSARISVVQMRYHSRELGGCPPACCGLWLLVECARPLVGCWAAAAASALVDSRQTW